MPLGQGEIESINAASLRILEAVGVRVQSDCVLGLLRKHGCAETADSPAVRIPRGLVEEALRMAPRRVRLCTLGGQERLLGPGVGSTFWTCNALNIIEGETVRPIGEQDFIDWVRVTESLESVFAAVAPSVADYPARFRDFVGFRLLSQYSTKHLRPCIYTPRGALAIIEMAGVLLGGVEPAQRPIVSFGYTIQSPLQWSSPAMELFCITSGHGIPLMINAEPTAGATAPVTLAGTLALANAEALSGVVIAQLLEPGRPVVYNLGFSHTLDMRSAITRTGGPENALLGAAGARLAAYHGLPSASWASTESMTEDAQAASEFALVASAHAAAGVNIIWGVGQLETQRAISLTQGVIDDEIAAAILHIQRGVQVDADTLAENVITSMAHSADYLAHEHTLCHFRDELFMPRLAFTQRWEAWRQQGGLSLRDRARQRVADVLTQPAECRLSLDVQRELLSVQQRWMQRLQ